MEISQYLHPLHRRHRLQQQNLNQKKKEEDDDENRKDKNVDRKIHN